MSSQPLLRKPPPSHRQLGPAIRWSDGELDQLAAIGPADVAAAQAYTPYVADPGQRALLGLLADLLNAQSDDGG